MYTNRHTANSLPVDIHCWAQLSSVREFVACISYSVSSHNSAGPLVWRNINVFNWRLNCLQVKKMGREAMKLERVPVWQVQQLWNSGPVRGLYIGWYRGSRDKQITTSSWAERSYTTRIPQEWLTGWSVCIQNSLISPTFLQAVSTANTQNTKNLI